MVAGRSFSVLGEGESLACFRKMHVGRNENSKWLGSESTVDTESRAGISALYFGV